MLRQRPSSRWTSGLVAWAIAVSGSCACANGAPTQPATPTAQPTYEAPETCELVALVEDAAKRLETQGDAALAEFRVPGSRWRHEETYVFVLDPAGTMLVHFDPALEGANQLGLEDVNGRSIVRGLLDAATAVSEKPYGWYHYEWPVPGGLLPRWKSSYVRLVTTPAGERRIVGAGMYDDRMERAFVVDLVDEAAGLIARMGEDAFGLLRERGGPFRVKDVYVFVMDARGIELVNPAFPNLEGRDLLDVSDTQGKPLVREMYDVVRKRGSGWVDYMWPKPGDSESTQKSTYVRSARLGDRWVLVGAGVYLADAPRAPPDPDKPTAPELRTLVRDAAALLEQHGEAAYAELRTKDSRWFHDHTYAFVWTLDGVRTFHAADPSLEGKPGSDATDIIGRPYGEMFLDVATSPSGEGWVHYMYPEPGGMFPVWKSAFIKRVTLPSGEQGLIGAGVYNMKMDRAFIEDLVDRASALVATQGRQAFDGLRDKAGAFVFMDTYVFVTAPDGTELVNPAQPSLEGTNLMGARDVTGKLAVREYITAAMRDGAAWVDYHWYRPGENTPTRKESYVRRVDAADGTFIVGAGRYVE
jgi:signal transduction histidine kinase